MVVKPHRRVVHEGILQVRPPPRRRRTAPRISTHSTLKGASTTGEVGCRLLSGSQCRPVRSHACADGRGGAASGQQQSSVRQHSMLTFRPTRDGGTLCCAVRCGAVRCGAVLAYPHAMPSTVAVRRARSASHRRMMRASMQWSRRASQRGTGPIDCSTRVSLTVLLLLGTWCSSTTYCL